MPVTVTALPAKIKKQIANSKIMEVIAALRRLRFLDL
jgi:hypothetical protein